MAAPQPPDPFECIKREVSEDDINATRVGAAYNVFDGEELLEASIRSIRPTVSYVVVVWQSVSNFGAKANAALLPRLRALHEEGLVDELVEYAPRTFVDHEKRDLVSPRATQSDLGGARPEDIAPAFFNELTKREIGRRRCLEAGCSYFMSMDTDECYDASKLRYALRRMLEGDHECAVCRMRHFFKDPRWQLVPLDEYNYVPCMYKLTPHLEFKIGCPYPFLMDPTRKLHRVTRLLELTRDEIEMYHYSFVRENIGSKLANVSNRGNYDLARIRDILEEFRVWEPRSGRPPVPHPLLKRMFRGVRVVENTFGVRVEGMEWNPELPIGSEYWGADEEEE